MKSYKKHVLKMDREGDLAILNTGSVKGILEFSYPQTSRWDLMHSATSNANYFFEIGSPLFLSDFVAIRLTCHAIVCTLWVECRKVY